jgi:hypothetical protein
VADLIVDSSLDDVNSALKDISDEFQHAQDNADPGFSVWGQWDLSRAMHDFAHNWSIHRGKIQGRLGTLSKHVDQSCQTWSDADKQLASSLATDDVPAAAAAAGASGTERVGTVVPNSGAGRNAAAASGTQRVGTVILGGGAGENAAGAAHVGTVIPGTGADGSAAGAGHVGTVIPGAGPGGTAAGAAHVGTVIPGAGAGAGGSAAGAAHVGTVVPGPGAGTGGNAAAMAAANASATESTGPHA